MKESIATKFLLRDNPFGIVPYAKEIVWADHKKFKAEIENVITFSIASTPSKFVACVYGDWGIGKSHAARYFSDSRTLENISKKIGVHPPLSLFIIFPMSDVFDSLYLDIIEEIGINEIKKMIADVIEEIDTLKSETALMDKLKEIVQDERLAKVLSRIKRSSEAVERYLLLSAKSSDLKTLNVARAIMTSSDKLKTLAGLFNLATHKLYSRIILWIDDMERVEFLSGKDLFELQVFIRDLLEHVPQKLNIIANFTLKPGQKVEDMIRYFGEAIFYRINRIIRAEPLTKEDYLEYVKDLLDAYREPKTEKIDPFFPFEKSTLEFVFEEMQRRGVSIVPRNINNVLSHILELAFAREDIKIIKKNFIESKDICDRVFQVLSTLKGE
ncbi:MAG: hypothetical protein NZ903_02820 [Candidatus Micrarchaeota archaeon]|nr:hypothetical protein [Candidatus Micrarchaeota archaeon]